MFNSTVTKEGNIHIVYLRGQLTLLNADEFSKVLLSLVNSENNEVILEMSELKHITSDGLKPLLTWVQSTQIHAVNGKRRLAVCNLQPYVKTIFSHAGFDRKFPVYGSISEAIQG
jgi:anti-anti-sigma factor